MRASLVLLLTLLPAATFAADAPRRLVHVENSARVEPVYGDVTVERALPPRGVMIEKRAGQKLRVTDGDGTPMSRSFSYTPPPRRIEQRVYYRDGEPALREPFALYGGFYGLDRWGVGRDDE